MSNKLTKTKKKPETKKSKNKSEVKKVDGKQKNLMKNNDLVYLSYTGYIKESGDVFDTTIEKEAKDKGIFRSNQVYEPILVAIGDGWVVKGLDNALAGKELNKKFNVNISAVDGFGERDPKKLIVYNRRKLIEAGLDPAINPLGPGMVVNINNLPAVVRTVSSGRALLDFNPPLAGKNITYDAKITAKCNSSEEKIVALVKRRYPDLAKKDKLYSVDSKTNTLNIYIAESEMNVQDFTFIKKGLSTDFFKFISNIKKVNYKEEIIKPDTEKETKPKN